jgi:Zn finger protein HypA/HybF involved in hydrogenase expression
MEGTLSTYKKYKQILHHAAGIQCLQCSKLFTREEFSLHLPNCKQNMMRQSTLIAAVAINPIKIRIAECKPVAIKPKITAKEKQPK